ncbi:hypothetical protein BJ508DRAFT_327131 [Ascobolus immersus RN42]|uniref:Uncharacterized protein n=1 Tax=Ascobolus immersus RN42 TaxID=1160509 RepID=A0A3N4I8X9_ASCIM|nr:hypothetical protein BJ508DRAFT_327131 [Ascobolus immersus RN42]
MPTGLGLGLQGTGFSPVSPNDRDYYYPTLSPRQHHFQQTQQQHPGANHEQRKALPPISTRVPGQVGFLFTPNPDSGFASSTSTPNFSFNTSSPMALPTSTPQSGRLTNSSFKDRLSKALAIRKKTSQQTEMSSETEGRPDSHGQESVSLTHTTTHSRSQSGVSTPPTGYSDPSPIFSSQMKQRGLESDEHNSFDDSDLWSHGEDQRYHAADGFNNEYMVRTAGYMPNTPLETIREEEARLAAHRSAIQALHSSSPAASRHPVHSSSFEVTVSTVKSHGEEDYSVHQDESGISSLRFGSSSQHLPIQTNAQVDADDSFGTNYYSSDESSYEGDQDEAQQVLSNPHLYQSSSVSRSLASYPASEYQNLTNPSFAGNSRHYESDSQNFESGEFVSQAFNTERSILPSHQTGETLERPSLPDNYPSSQTLPTDSIKRAEPSVTEMLSFIPTSSQKSSSRPALSRLDTDASFAGMESGPNVVVSGTMEAAKASSSILGGGSIRSGSDDSSIPSRKNSNNRSAVGSAGNSAGRLAMGPRSNSNSSRGFPVSPLSFGGRPGLSRNASDRSPASPGTEDYFRRDLESHLKRLSIISASSDANSSGIAVVVNVDENKIHTSSFRGSIELLSGFDGNSKHASMQSRRSGESQDGLLSDSASPAIAEEETRTDSRLSPEGELSKNSSGSSRDSQENVVKNDTKKLKSLQLPADVLLHPADPRYEHVYRMREVDPTEERIMVPVYQFPTPGSFPNRNALTRPITSKVSQRLSQGIESGSIASLRSSRAKTPDLRRGEFEDIPLTPLGSGSRPKLENRGSDIRQQLKTHSISSAPSSIRLPVRSKSPSFHIDLEAPAPVADVHPALRPPRYFRPASPHLVPSSSFYRIEDLEASRMTASPEALEQATRLSRFLFLCCFLFPPCLLILAYGGFDGIVAEISKGKVAGVTDHYKKVAKWVGWGIAVTIVAGVTGAIIGAVLVSSTSLGA